MTSDNQPDKYGQPWAHDELVLAFELYCRIPFKLTKANNPEVIDLARLLHRSPASVARKLGNFGAFDPELRKQNISGLTHVGKLDQQVWEEFHRNWNALVLQAYELRKSLGGKIREIDELVRPTGPSERVATVKQRLHQSFFREAILSSYERKCCVTGINVPECLVASHIVPWSKDEKFRTDPSNGLCLSATFDRLFDEGLMTVSDDLVVVIAGRLLRSRNKEVQGVICAYHQRPIFRPRRFVPSSEHLNWHRSNVFVGD
jgi:hypothetical protein